METSKNNIIIGTFNYCYNEEYYGTVTTDSKVYIVDSFEKSKKALSNDTVEYKNGTIIKIIKRNSIRMEGVLYTSSNILLGTTKNNVPYKKFKPHSKKYPPFMVSTRKKLQSTDTYIIAQFKEWNSTKYPIGVIIKEVGNVGDFKAEKEYLKYRNSIFRKPLRFNPKDYLIDLTPIRRDFTDLITFSIDPPGCRDIDDAMSIEFLSNNIVRFYVHIADVSSYIPENSKLDNIIKKRVESLYLKDNQINMLPDNFAFEICSLIKNKKRRAFTTILDTHNGKIVRTNIMKSAIINNYNLTYNECEEIVSSKDHKLYKHIRPFYDFGKTIINNNYNSHKMVEAFMVLTNSTIAQYFDKTYPEKGIYRKHDTNIISNIKGNKELDQALKFIEIIKSESAKYQIGSKNAFHRSLNIKLYTHFTSPIRRYVDILVHRLLFKILDGNYIQPYSNKLMDSINIMQKNIRKAHRESIRLHKIYDINKKYDGILDTYGYIINIAENILSVYIPKLDLETECKLFSNKLKKSLNWESTDKNIVLKSTDKNITYSLYQKIIIKFIISIKSNSFRSTNCRTKSIRNIEQLLTYIFISSKSIFLSFIHITVFSGTTSHPSV